LHHLGRWRHVGEGDEAEVHAARGGQVPEQQAGEQRGKLQRAARQLRADAQRLLGRRRWPNVWEWMNGTP
ncbi:MAG TPA: hypothetical protein VHQ87_00725, partial [Rhizobacter sp.]|nr:hypothetical protein [Rhizobacter sp.]